MLKRITIFVLVVGFLIIGCKDNEASELLDKGTLHAETGKIIAVGLNYIVMKDQFGKKAVIGSVTNIDDWKHLAEKFLRGQTNAIIVYREVTHTTIEYVAEKK